MVKWLWDFRFYKKKEITWALWRLSTFQQALFFKQSLLIYFLFLCLVVKTLVRLAHSHVKTVTHKFARVSVKLLASSRLQLNVFVSTEFLRAGQFHCHSSPVDHTLILMTAIFLVLQTQDTVTSSNSLLWRHKSISISQTEMTDSIPDEPVVSTLPPPPKKLQNFILSHSALC